MIIEEISGLNPEAGAGTGVPVIKPIQEKSVLWLNAGKLDDDAFDELVGVLSNYEGETVCKIVRGDKRYKMPAGVNYCRGLLAELMAFIGIGDIKFIDNT